MTAPADKQQPAAKISRKLMLRRGSKIMRDVPARSLVKGIKEGKLFPTDEFSADSVNWFQLGRHYQLSKLFSSSAPNPPPKIEEELGQLADLLREINEA